MVSYVSKIFDIIITDSLIYIPTMRDPWKVFWQARHKCYRFSQATSGTTGPLLTSNRLQMDTVLCQKQFAMQCWQTVFRQSVKSASDIGFLWNICKPPANCCERFVIIFNAPNCFPTGCTTRIIGTSRQKQLLAKKHFPQYN